MQSTHRRLKYLFHNGFLGRISPFIQPGQGSGELAYCLDKEGFKLLEEQNEKLLSRAINKKVKHYFLDHALAISEFRVNLELALLNHPTVEMARFTAEFEVKSHIQKIVNKRSYKLYDEIIHPIDKKSYVVEPDALIVLKGKGRYTDVQNLYFVEIDRHTESLSKIRRKIIGYNLYFKQKAFAKFGKFDRFKVLFQTNSEKRTQNIWKSLVDMEGSRLVWIAESCQVNEQTILHSPIWLNSQAERRSILK